MVAVQSGGGGGCWSGEVERGHWLSFEKWLLFPKCKSFSTILV